MHAPTDSHLAAQCGICGTILTGAVSVIYRGFGIKRSPRNPNICTRCSTHVEEGRLVELTVLFADLSSFTELTHDLGAEKTHEVVDAFLRMASDVLVRYGAFIDKYVGDAVMALFNVPIRYDDHARRAIVAAIDLGSGLKTLGARLDLPLQVSVGIATGYARVGRLGSDDSKDYTAIGDVVNLAARLQSKAGASEILIAKETYLKHSEQFPDAQSEQIVLKGFREPVTAYRLHGIDWQPKNKFWRNYFRNLGRAVRRGDAHRPARGGIGCRRALWSRRRANFSRSKCHSHPNTGSRYSGGAGESLHPVAGAQAQNGVQGP